MIARCYRRFSLLIQSDGFNKRTQSGRLIPTTGIVEKITGKRWAPIFQDLNQAPFCNQVSETILHRCADSHTTQRCLDDKFWIIKRCRSLGADRQCLAALLKLPSVQTVAEPKSYAGMVLKILRMFRDAIRLEVLRRSNYG